MTVRPTQENVGDVSMFERAMQIVLKRSGKKWPSLPERYQHDVLSWHFLQLHMKYDQMVDSKDER
eukprot:3167764-Karenia_brevis.AAC.1